MVDGIELFRERLEALYESDARGRIVRSNEWDGRPAPRFHLMLTAQGPITRFRGDVADDLAAELDAICQRESHAIPGPDGPTQRTALLEALGAHEAVQRVWCGPAYRLPEHVGFDTSSTIPIGAADSALLAPCFPDWLDDPPHRQPFIAVVENGRAVSVCASVRISATVHCAGVETHPDHRRRGHSLRAVAGWASAVRAMGATPFYSTSWDNIASQHIARRLGFELVGVDFHVA